jgi:hypothetical protein
MAILWFSAEGSLEEVEDLPVPEDFPVDSFPNSTSWTVHHILEWQKRVGYLAAPIRVRHFFIEQPVLIAIRLLPEWAIEFLQNPYLYPDLEEREYFRDSISKWLESGKFVLYWGEEDFYIEEDGRVD